MPYVNIKVSDEGVTKKQKQQLIQGTTKLLADLLGKDPATIFVAIDEVDMNNWGVAGELVSELRKIGKFSFHDKCISMISVAILVILTG